MVQYNVALEDSVLTFDSNISFGGEAQFRGQDLDMVLYIPYNQPFKMEYDLRHIIRNTIYRHGYSVHDMDIENTWIFTPAGLECLTCDKQISRYDKNSHYSNDYGKHSRVFDNSGFNEIEIGSAFESEIEFGEEYNVTLIGEENDIDEIEVFQDGNVINFKYQDEKYKINYRDRQRVKVRITVPELRSITVHGASKIYVSGFNADKLSVHQHGASYCSIDSDFEEIEAEIHGASELVLKGQGEELNLSINGASEVDAYNYQVKFAEVDADGIGQARLYVTDRIELDASLVSDINYRGGAELIEK